MTPLFPPDYPEILADLAMLVYQRVQDSLTHLEAADLARQLAEDVRLKWGGGLIYIPKGANYERQQRDDEIWRLFNGRNHGELARHYRLTLSQIYDIISRERTRQAELIFRPPE